MKEKIMHFANFNITFGEEGEPLLSHFADFVFPALLSNCIRREIEEYPQFFFRDVKIKRYKDEYILVGNYIKNTMYDVRTVFANHELIGAPSTIPTAPYSRFIVRLKNHRMILVRNESASPDIRSFQKTLRYVLSSYVSAYNKKHRPAKIPSVDINIVDMMTKDEITSIINNMDKITELRLRFFKLNGDTDPSSTIQAIRELANSVGSKTSHAVLNSPKSKPGVQKVLEETALSGTAETTLEGLDSSGHKRKIKSNSFTASTKIGMGRDIEASDDEYLLDAALNNESMRNISAENQRNYNEALENIFRLSERGI
ncbi:hypothetical protein FACS18949_09830 [Clostridia bacterium]|nr:hypothetical protein FACS18949_09830 [Clostridia bacterium]